MFWKERMYSYAFYYFQREVKNTLSRPYVSHKYTPLNFLWASVSADLLKRAVGLPSLPCKVTNLWTNCYHPVEEINKELILVFNTVLRDCFKLHSFLFPFHSLSFLFGGGGRSREWDIWITQFTSVLMVSKAWIIYQVGHTLNKQGAEDSYLTVFSVKFNIQLQRKSNLLIRITVRY